MSARLAAPVNDVMGDLVEAQIGALLEPARDLLSSSAFAELRCQVALEFSLAQTHAQNAVRDWIEFAALTGEQDRHEQDCTHCREIGVCWEAGQLIRREGQLLGRIGGGGVR